MILISRPSTFSRLHLRSYFRAKYHLLLPLLLGLVAFHGATSSAQEESTGDADNPATITDSVAESTSVPSEPKDEVKQGRPGLQAAVQVERNLVFRKVDGTELKADLYRPGESPGGTKHPMVLMVHGGAWSLGDKWDLIMHGRELAEAGFVAVSINYRLAPKYKMADQLEDCRQAARWSARMANEWNADSDRLAIWGYSAGAHLASLVALDRQEADPQFAAVVAGGAPCEFSFVPEESRLLAYVMGGSRKDAPEVYEKFAPINYVDSQAPPFFLFHGTKDLLVPGTSSKKLHAKLQSHQVASEYVSVKDKGHLMTFLDKDTRAKVIDFLKRNLEVNE